MQAFELMVGVPKRNFDPASLYVDLSQNFKLFGPNSPNWYALFTCSYSLPFDYEYFCNS